MQYNKYCIGLESKFISILEKGAGVVVVHAFILSTWEAEADQPLSPSHPNLQNLYVFF